jgi:hypothetical protein
MAILSRSRWPPVQWNVPRGQRRKWNTSGRDWQLEEFRGHGSISMKNLKSVKMSAYQLLWFKVFLLKNHFKNKFLNNYIFSVIEEKAKLEGAATSPKKATPSVEEVVEQPELPESLDDKEKAVEAIEEAFLDHQRRERALAGMKAKFHIARPWQKKKAEAAASAAVEESSEEELERAYRTLHLKGNDIRAKVSIIKADQELFTNGKVSEMKARLSERRNKAAARSDGITEEEDDDDEDVVY